MRRENCPIVSSNNQLISDSHLLIFSWRSASCKASQSVRFFNADRIKSNQEDYILISYFASF